MLLGKQEGNVQHIVLCLPDLLRAGSSNAEVGVAEAQVADNGLLDVLPVLADRGPPSLAMFTGCVHQDLRCCS